MVIAAQLDSPATDSHVSHALQSVPFPWPSRLPWVAQSASAEPSAAAAMNLAHRVRDDPLSGISTPTTQPS